MVERMAEAAERDDNPYSGMSEEDYAALCAAEEAEAEGGCEDGIKVLLSINILLTLG